MFAYASNVPTINAPDTHWAYSTGTSMIVAAHRRPHGGRRAAEMLAFMHRELFDPIGMRTAVPEFDAAGTFLGGHGCGRRRAIGPASATCTCATACGMAGVCCRRAGSTTAGTPAPAPNNGVYGAHLWLNLEPKPKQFAPLPGGPHSAVLSVGQRRADGGRGAHA